MVNWKRVGLGAGAIGAIALAGYGVSKIIVPEEKCTEEDTKTLLCPDGFTITTHTCVDGIWKPTGIECPPPPPPPPPPPDECTHGQTQTETCPDGTTIITYNCINGQWVATGNKCPPPECTEKAIYHGFCWDVPQGQPKRTIIFKCQGGKWVLQTPPECPYHHEDLVQNMTINHVWIRYTWTPKPLKIVIMEYYDNSDGKYKETFHLGNSPGATMWEKLINTLDWLRTNDKINDIQYNNAKLQGKNMGW